MIKFSTPTSLAGAALLAVTACVQDPAQTGVNDPNRKAKQGALIGGAVGAVAGAISGDTPEERRQNALKGAVIGGGAGAIVGNQLDRQEAALRRDLNNDQVDINNTGDRLIVTLPQDILFATDSTAVRADLRRDLGVVAGNLQAYPNSRIQIIGHTDNTGDASYNQDLSERRAQAVSSILVSDGVAPSRVQSFGRGETQPVASNLTPEGRAQNRRVEIVVLPTG